MWLYLYLKCMNKQMSHTPSRSPWAWIPTLYVAEGLPYFAVNTLTVLIYTKMGVGLKEMALCTGWLYLPWTLKPFWSPFIDLVRTKRWWVLAMQLTIALSMLGVAVFLPGSNFFVATLAVFWVMAFCSATHDIAADGYYMLELDPHRQAAYVGVRSTFYRIASITGQGGLVILAGAIENRTGDVPYSWQCVFWILSAFFALVFLWHLRAMPVSPLDKPERVKGAADIMRGFLASFRTFFRKREIIPALMFMLLYRLPEALCLKVVTPFMVATRSEGGLALSTSQVGIVNGTVGVVALLAGGILGGLAIARRGLKFWLWPMAMSLTLPCVLYVVLAWWQPIELWPVATAVLVEQFGYGFGFSAFMLYLIYFSRGEFQTSHYSFCTAFMAIGMMVPGMTAGWLFEIFGSLDLGGNTAGEQGYFNFFVLVMLSCIATFIACACVRIDRNFGCKRSEQVA